MRWKEINEALSPKVAKAPIPPIGTVVLLKSCHGIVLDYYRLIDHPQTHNYEHADPRFGIEPTHVEVAVGYQSWTTKWPIDEIKSVSHFPDIKKLIRSVRRHMDRFAVEDEYQEHVREWLLELDEDKTGLTLIRPPVTEALKTNIATKPPLWDIGDIIERKGYDPKIVVGYVQSEYSETFCAAGPLAHYYVGYDGWRIVRAPVSHQEKIGELPPDRKEELKACAAKLVGQRTGPARAELIKIIQKRDIDEALNPMATKSPIYNIGDIITRADNEPKVVVGYLTDSQSHVPTTRDHARAYLTYDGNIFRYGQVGWAEDTKIGQLDDEDRAKLTQLWDKKLRGLERHNWPIRQFLNPLRAKYDLKREGEGYDD